MRLSYLLVTLLLSIFPILATAQGTYSPKDMRFLYGKNIIGNSDPTVRNNLQQLRTAGINVIAIDGEGSATISFYQNQLQLLRQDPLLSTFKVVLKVDGPDYTYWNNNKTQVCAAGASLPQSLGQLLDGLAALGSQNADIVVGYYTFDEPARTSTCIQYQENVYQRLRQGDPNSSLRPIIIANNLFPIADANIPKYVSPSAQDVAFVDQYDPSITTQTSEYTKWKNIGVNVVVPVLPAYNATTCTANNTNNNPALQAVRSGAVSAIASVYGGKPSIYGTAYFAFWPEKLSGNPNYLYDAQNCTVLFNSVINDLQHNLLPEIHIILSNPATAGTTSVPTPAGLNVLRD